MVGLVASAVIVLLAYLPLADHVLIWQDAKRQGGSLRAAATLLAATVGWVITALFAFSRSLKLSTSTLRGEGTIGDRLRIPLDLAYDIATFLREPGRYQKKYKKPVPRDKILARFSGLMHHLNRVRQYDRCVIVAHSQGAVLATAMLNQPDCALPLPGRGTALVTMGNPLRHIYAWRLPTQFEWVRDLSCLETPRYVTRVDGPWINYGANRDLVGRTVFYHDSDGVMDTKDHTCANMTDRRSGGKAKGAFNNKADNHGSYWTDVAVMTRIGDLILDGFSRVASSDRR